MSAAVSTPLLAIPDTVQPAPPDGLAAQVGRANVAVGWWMTGLSMSLGALVGLWAFGGPFAPPAWFGGYDDPARRMLRLAHIAGIMLPVLNFHFLRGLAGTGYSVRAARRLCRMLLAGSVGLPLTLVLAAVWRPGLLLLPLPVVAVMTPVFFLAAGLGWAGWRKQRSTV